MRWIRSTLAIVLFAVLVVPAMGGGARADAGSNPEIGIDWREVLDYAGCIISIIGATNGPGVAAATATCGKAIMDHWND